MMSTVSEHGEWHPSEDVPEPATPQEIPADEPGTPEPPPQEEPPGPQEVPSQTPESTATDDVVA